MKNAAETGRQKSNDLEQRATFRFYEELNAFLPPERRKIAFNYAFNGTRSAKDSIETIGAPGEIRAPDRLVRSQTLFFFVARTTLQHTPSPKLSGWIL